MSKVANLYEEARQYLVGGASAGGRFHSAFKQPLYIARADGPYLYDLDGVKYIDYHTSAGPALYGYNNPRLNKAAMKALDDGNFSYFENEAHLKLAKMLIDFIPCAEMVRLSNTGTEASMGAIRLARGYTRKDIIIRFQGHFHGMHEGIWYNHAKAGAVDAYGEIGNVPDSAGVPDVLGSVVKNVEFNDIEALTRVVNRYKGNVAAIMLEPISYNCGCMPARAEYLEQVRQLCMENGIVLIFDEVISGFRLRPGSAQAYYGVTPDVTILAKALGGGFPIAAVVGKREIMERFAPLGPVGMSGTYTGSYMSVLAAIECLTMVQEDWFYDKIDQTADMLYGGINDLFQKHGIPGHVRGMGARFGLYFGIENPEYDYKWSDISAHFDRETYLKFLNAALREGLYLHNYGMAPTPSHCGFSSAHSLEDVAVTLEKMDKAFRTL